MKRRYLIASHGRLASGLQHSLEVLTGRGEEFAVIDAYVDDSDYTEVLVGFVNQLHEDEQGLIFTDLLGGSVNQKVVQTLMDNPKDNVLLISNINLATILSLAYAKPDEALTLEDIHQVVAESQVTAVDLALNNNDEADFFD
ncbi:PTS mannnose transporter subunit IIA [Streptococcus halotolerans]|uniref:PTS sugar transporter subunit IIA domain-containing protein n=1 Tax=Streptococcus halotolerans TaxID=1814128 RepID=UPI000787B8C2|nr:PTS mannnose transporter subunit IIA [Streptococcus halotolerans]